MFIARANETAAIDMIPLEEIHTVIAMKDDFDAAAKPQQASQSTTRGVPSAHKRSLEFDRKRDLAHNENSPDVNEMTVFFGNANLNNILQIQTDLEGSSAGRTLYFSTRNGLQAEKRRQAIVSALSAAVAEAKRKALALSRFQKSQEKVLLVQGSMAFQIAMAMLIMLVSSLFNTRARGATGIQALMPRAICTCEHVAVAQTHYAHTRARTGSTRYRAAPR